MFDKKEAREKIKAFVEKYERLKAQGKFNLYNEEMTKKDFITPLFEDLGWDVYNKKADEVSDFHHLAYDPNPGRTQCR